MRGPAKMLCNMFLLFLTLSFFPVHGENCTCTAIENVNDIPEVFNSTNCIVFDNSCDCFTFNYLPSDCDYFKVIENVKEEWTPMVGIVPSTEMINIIDAFNPTVDLRLHSNITNELLEIIEEITPTVSNFTEEVMTELVQAIDNIEVKVSPNLTEVIDIIDDFNPTVELSLHSNITGEFIEIIEEITPTVSNFTEEIITDVIQSLSPMISNFTSDFLLTIDDVEIKVSPNLTEVIDIIDDFNPTVELSLHSNITGKFIEIIEEITPIVSNFTEEIITDVTQSLSLMISNFTSDFLQTIDDNIYIDANASTAIKDSLVKFLANPKVEISVDEDTTQFFVNALIEETSRSNFSDIVFAFLNDPYVKVDIQSGNSSLSNTLNSWQPQVVVHPNKFITIITILSACSASGWILLGIYKLVSNRNERKFTTRKPGANRSAVKPEEIHDIYESPMHH